MTSTPMTRWCRCCAGGRTGDRALSARLRPDALSRPRHDAHRAAGGARPRPDRAAGRARHPARHSGRLRLGWPRVLRRRGAVAGARAPAWSLVPATTSMTSTARARRRAGEGARAWYQIYFHTERGREGLTQNRREIAPLLWEQWSPGWAVRRGDLRAHGGVLRQPGLRRGGDPLLSLLLRHRRQANRRWPRWRSAWRGNPGSACLR